MLFNKTKTSKLSDKALIDRFSEDNDLEVLGILYNRYLHLVYGVCLKYLKNREDSQDAVMQIFEKLIIEVPKHDIQVFKSWLYGLSRNFCLMQLRSAKSKGVLKLVNFEENFMENAAESHPLDESLDEVALKNLADCFKELKQEQQQCVEMFYYEQQCYREIAEHLNLEEKKIKSYLQNGKRNLKNCLDNKKLERG